MLRFLKAVAALFLLSVVLVFILRWVPIVETPIMLLRSVQNIGNEKFETRKNWVPLKEISPELVKAVIASEDNRFFTHHGFDFEQISKAIEENKTRKRERGASTISQQTAKNVFTFHTHTWIRKGIETYFTILIELIWGKERIMEVYLNVVELGKGIYGAQAASEYYFGCKAKQLSRHQACLFAACIPSPLKMNPSKPGSYTIKRSIQISNLIPKLDYPKFLCH